MTEITELYVRGCALEHLAYHARKKGKHLAAKRFRNEAIKKLVRAARLKASKNRNALVMAEAEAELRSLLAGDPIFCPKPVMLGGQELFVSLQ